MSVRWRLPLRVVLLILACVPSAAMVALLAVNSSQLYDTWHTAEARENVAISGNGAVPATVLYYDLQQERKLSAAVLADPSAFKAGLAQVRKLTDASATTLAAFAGLTSPNVVASLQQFETRLRQISGFRASVDDGTATQQQAYDNYTGLISANLELFAALTTTGVAEIDVITAPAGPTGWGEEMISREDAIITAGAVSGRLTAAQSAQVAQAVGAEQFIYQNTVIPSFPQVAGLYQNMLASKPWQQKTQVEQGIANAPVSSSGVINVPPALGQQWQQTMGSLTPELQQLAGAETGVIVRDANAHISSLKTRLVVQTVLGAVGVVLVIGFTLWLVSILRRRIFALRMAAEELQTKLPDVVERLRNGEAVDTDAELPALPYGEDELGMLGRALNAARASALETSVRQVEQYRGFERLLQRIARRTQLLIGLQMKRLSEMERRHEDAAVLEGLFELDHLTARLRRYEENLVILGGGQTQRRWRKPVPLLNVLRSAQGEVQDYPRIRIETQSSVWISEHAVGALVHVLAELMENAVAFSKPPAPVEVTAAPVARGLAIEIEDRGVGLDAEQYAAANALMMDPPRMDVLSRADDARLGLYVVARLAAKLGVKVELRPSAFGGTRVVVLIPAELVLAGDHFAPAEQSDDDAELTRRLSLVPDLSDATTASVLNGFGESTAPRDQSDRLLVGVGAGTRDSADAPPLKPLPRRVRQESLAAELRETPRAEHDLRTQADFDTAPPAHEPSRSAATIGAFQRQSREARLAADDEPLSTDEPPPPPTHEPPPPPAPEPPPAPTHESPPDQPSSDTKHTAEEDG